MLILTISYLPIEKVALIRNILNDIDKEEFLKTYNSRELNEQGIYPENWHDNQSIDLAFNKQDLFEAFETLKRLFNQASEKKNYILTIIE